MININYIVYVIDSVAVKTIFSIIKHFLYLMSKEILSTDYKLFLMWYLLAICLSATFINILSKRKHTCIFFTCNSSDFVNY